MTNNQIAKAVFVVDLAVYKKECFIQPTHFPVGRISFFGISKFILFGTNRLVKKKKTIIEDDIFIQKAKHCTFEEEFKPFSNHNINQLHSSSPTDVSWLDHKRSLVSYLEEERVNGHSPAGLVCVTAVNYSYGVRGWFCTPRRLYETVNTVCCMTGQCRGLTILR